MRNELVTKESFITHSNRKRLFTKMGKPFSIYSLSFIIGDIKGEDGEKEKGLKTFLNIVAQPSTVQNSYLVRENLQFRDTCSNWRKVKKGTKKMIVLDFSSIAKETDIVSTIMESTIYLVSNPHGKDDFCIEEDGHYVSLLNLAGYKKEQVLLQETFGGSRGCQVATPSQGRQNKICLYANTTDQDIRNFRTVRNIGSIGQFNKTFELKEIIKWTNAAIVNKNVRMSSKDTNLALTKFQGCEVKNILILCSKDSNADGKALITENCIINNANKVKLRLNNEYLIGNCIQCRPYTSKVAALIVSQNYIDAAIRDLNILTIKRENIAEYQTEQLDLLLNKDSKVKSDFLVYDGVAIVEDEDSKIDFIGDLNAFKDAWDYSLLDGINMLNITHGGDIYTGSSTSYQMLKTMAYNAVDAGKYEEFNKVIEEIAIEHIDAIFNDFYEAKPRVPGFELFEDQDNLYLSSLIRQINPSTLYKYPKVLGQCIMDINKTVSNAISGMKFDTAGYYCMMTPDMANDFGKRNILSIKEDYVEIVNKSAEVYFKDKGIPESEWFIVAVKYPCMGDREYVLCKCISPDEIHARIDNLEADIETTYALHEIYDNVKEGLVVTPADIELANIIAGADWDGDDMQCFFDRRIVDFYINRKPIAVNITPPHMELEVLDSSCYNLTSYANAMVEQLAFGNLSVGMVTNMFRSYSELDILMKTDKRKYCIIALDKLRKIIQDKDGDFYKALFNLCIYDLAVDMGYKPYIGLTPDMEKDIVNYSITAEDFLDCLMQFAYFKYDNTEEKEAAYAKFVSDMDKIGRYVQELTIDAQKKFYEVLVPASDDLARIKVAPLEYGVTFSIPFDSKSIEIKLEDNNIMKETPTIVYSKDNKLSKYIIPDSLTKARNNIINFSIEKFEALRKAYFKAEEARIKNSVKLIKTSEDRKLEEAVKIINSMGIDLASYYKESVSYMRKMFPAELLNASKTTRRIQADINNQIKEQSDHLYKELSNNARNILGINKDNLYDIITKFFETDKGYKLVGKILKPEFLYKVIKDGEVDFIGEKIRFKSDEYKDLYKDGDIVTITNGKLEDNNGMCKNITGEFTIREYDGDLYATKDVEEVLDIPEADKSKIMLRTSYNSGADLLFEELVSKKHLKIGDKIELAYDTNSNGNPCLGFLVDGKPMTGVVNNKRIYALFDIGKSTMLGKACDNKIATISGISSYKSENKKNIYLFHLEDLTTTEAIEESIKEVSNDNSEQYNNELEDCYDIF